MGCCCSKECEEDEQRAREEAQQRREEEQRKREEEERIRRQKDETTRARESQKIREALRILEERRRQYNEWIKQELEQRRKKEAEYSFFVEGLEQGKVTKNVQLINDLQRAFNLCAVKDFPDNAYNEKNLSENSRKYRQMHNMFRRSNKPIFQVTKISQVDNIFLLLHYKLMKVKFEMIEGRHIKEKIVFHGTKDQFLDNICTFNFDRSKIQTYTFGKGLSFARDSYYATHYSDVRNHQKVMILTQIFFGEMTISNQDTIVPEEPCYTSTNSNGSVFVKYDDASYYPAYIVRYEGFHPPKQIAQRSRSLNNISQL